MKPLRFTARKLRAAAGWKRAVRLPQQPDQAGAAQIGGEGEAGSRLPQDVDVGSFPDARAELHAGRRFVRVERVGADDDDVAAEQPCLAILHVPQATPAPSGGLAGAAQRATIAEAIF